MERSIELYGGKVFGVTVSDYGLEKGLIFIFGVLLIGELLGVMCLPILNWSD